MVSIFSLSHCHNVTHTHRLIKHSIPRSHPPMWVEVTEASEERLLISSARGGGVFHRLFPAFRRRNLHLPFLCCIFAVS